MRQATHQHPAERLPFRLAIRYLILQTTYNFLAILIVVAVAYFLLAQNILQDLRLNVRTIAERAAETVDVEAHETLVDPAEEDSAVYQRLVDVLRLHAHANPIVDSIYTLRPTAVPQQFVFVLDTYATADKNENGVIDPDEEKAHLGEPYDTSEFPELERGLIEPSADAAVTSDKWGQWISGYAPLQDAEGDAVAVLGVDVSAQQYWSALSEIRRLLTMIALIGLAFSLLIGYIGLRLFDRTNQAVLHRYAERAALIDNAPFGIMTVKTDGTIHLFNQKMGELLGTGRPEAVKGKPLSFLAVRDLTSFNNAFQKGLTQPLAEQEAMVAGDGPKRHLRYSVSPIYGADQAVEQVLFIAEDVTSHRELDQKLHRYSSELEKKVQQRTAELEELTKLYRLVVDKSLMGIYAIQDNVFRFVNPALLLMFGYAKAEEVIGRPWTDFVTAEGQKEVVASGLKKRMNGQGDSKHYTFHGRHKDGREIIVEVLSNPGTYEGKKAVIGTMRNVTELKAAERKLVELNQLRSEFIQIIAHQMRTPLNAIRWNLEALLSEEMGKLKKEQKEFIRLTHDAEVKVIERIHDMLTAVDIEEGRLMITKEPVALEGLVNSVVGEMERLAKVKGVRFEYRPPKKPLPAVAIDAEKIREAMSKILANAVVYTSKKGKVSLKIAATDGMVRFSVTDTGIGIPEAEQARIGTRFYRATNAAAALPDASGLSLAIVKYLIEAHGGHFGFSSKEGEGSTFWFDLPKA